MNDYIKLAERRGQPHYVKKVRQWLEICLDAKLSLGERMLVRQTVERCFDDLRKIESNESAFDIKEESFARFLMYYRGVPAKMAHDCISGYVDRDKLRALRQRENRDY